MGRLNCGALVLINSISSSVCDAWRYVVPYLDHFGVPYTVVDLLRSPLPTNVMDYALVIVAHANLDPECRRLSLADRQALMKAIATGVGLVSFDPAYQGASDIAGDTDALLTVAASSDTVVFADEHPITSLHDGQPIDLVQPLSIPPMAASSDAVLLRIGGSPLLSVHTIGTGRVVRWASVEWAQTGILGPLGGLDDVFWRSLVWAARKPFVLRGMPPIVGMRVDDVAGTGHVWDQPPLWWVHVCNRYGFKPWLGLFLYNLTPEAITVIRALVAEGKATAFPHAFGRPPRAGKFDYIATYADDVLPLRSSTYDEFIYFDHEHGRPWPGNEAVRRMAAVDRWHTEHGIPISKYAVPHWYEMGQNVAVYMHDRWGVEFVCKIQDADLPLAAEHPWLPLAPFRLHEPPGACHFDVSRRSGRPVYYADFVNFGGRRFFNCVTEIRDDAGYEWAPDADVPQTVGRGIRQLRRALDSMALPVLFTHETDYIYKISPIAWEAEIKQIATAIRHYEPIFLTMDEAARYVRALRTSRLVSTHYDASQRRLAITLQGSIDVPIQCQVFNADASGEESFKPTRVEVSEFADEITINCDL